ncbi:unnamed protein product [Bursaphelenchus okinawaensis]|uniref:Uncharacterized protein n=1 Tax=Bursaphelenchus okinawaensis TaxID=465554 RepID=A0A811L4I5_9BILA|nr:unnamed protein product [Bursaphelenchus okinawaensis]CAG9116582.1 unnamed protein product [Bursaphelenchus okinawaensis]
MGQVFGRDNQAESNKLVKPRSYIDKLANFVVEGESSSSLTDASETTFSSGTEYTQTSTDSVNSTEEDMSDLEDIGNTDEVRTTVDHEQQKRIDHWIQKATNFDDHEKLQYQTRL